MTYYLAIDLGTTGCRSMLFDRELTARAASYREYGLITPRENYTEQNAEDYFSLMAETSREAIANSGVDPSDIVSMSISSQGITVIPVDRCYRPISNAISWLDNRAESETEEIIRDFGYGEIFTLTGKPPISAYTLPKILWMMRNMPEVYERAYKLLMPMDFLVARLTGRAVTDYSMASGTLMYDLRGFCWSREILEKYGIDENKLPEIKAAGCDMGKILPEAARLLGVGTECRVSLGAQDQKCAALAVGLCDGVMTTSLGTAAAVTKLWKSAHTETVRSVGWCGYTEGDAFVTEGVVGTAATCLRWVRDRMYPGESYEVIDREAEDAARRGTSLIYHPYMSGGGAPEYYKDATGNFYGVNLATERGDFALAVMEGVAFNIKKLLISMEAYGSVHTLILFGGGAKSELWCQLMADITGMRVATPSTEESAGAGAAMLAARAVGDKLDPLRLTKIYEPSEKTDYYAKKFARFLEIEKKLWSETK